jgi:hypothetical protein
MGSVRPIVEKKKKLWGINGRLGWSALHRGFFLVGRGFLLLPSFSFLSSLVENQVLQGVNFFVHFFLFV